MICIAADAVLTNKAGNMKNTANKKTVILVNLILVILEIIALIHDIRSFGAGMFKWYTIDCNVLQLVVSGLILYCCVKDREISGPVTVLHFISAVGLTVTFLIAAFVLAPEGGIRYYFIDNVAPVNHLIAPVLSVVSLLFLEKSEKQNPRIILYPAAATLAYGIICLVLNAIGKLEGPYFFLETRVQPVNVIILWFGIIAVLCVFLAGLYYRIKWK